MATKKQKSLFTEDDKLQTEVELATNEATGIPDTAGQPVAADLGQTVTETVSENPDTDTKSEEEMLLDEASPGVASEQSSAGQTETENEAPGPGVDDPDEMLQEESTGVQADGQTETKMETPDLNPDEEKLPGEILGGEAGGQRAAAQTETKDEKNQRRPRKTGSDQAQTRENQTQSDAGANSKGDDAVARKDLPKRRPSPKTETVMSIDAQRTVETEADKAKNDLLDLLESLKTGRILAGTIQGVERATNNQSMAVIYHGAFKVIIPAEEAVEPPSDFRDQSPADVLHYLLTKRLGAEVDYIIKGIDQNAGVAVASRLDAMRAKRKQYYFGVDREGNNILYAGICAESRVVSVIRAGVFVDLFGLEVYIPLRELSYQRMMDATGVFRPGQRILVKVLEIERNDRNHIKAIASVKQAGENPYEKALRRYTIDNRYVGTVSVVDTNGVFVALDGGIDCLCSYPKRGRPPRGARVTVRILGINHETNRIWGAITHIATPG